MAWARVFMSCYTSLSKPPFSNHLPRKLLKVSASVSFSTSDSSAPPLLLTDPPNTRRWKPLCLYHTHGKCTKMDDPMHLGKFNHNISAELQLNATEFKDLCPQNLDYFLVLDLEGKVEILEFPVVMIDAKTINFVDSFHRFVKPEEMSEQRINGYIEGKYGKLGVDRYATDSSLFITKAVKLLEYLHQALLGKYDSPVIAIPFKEVLQQFQIWMANHHLWKEEQGGSLHQAAFVTCGNWDLKTKVPQQCKVARIKMPPYFMEWINLKDVYLNFYKRRATGMMTMMKELGIPLMGSHHLGIDDAKNISRVLQRMLTDGAVLQITARRNKRSGDVKFLFKNRIR